GGWGGGGGGANSPPSGATPTPAPRGRGVRRGRGWCPGVGTKRRRCGTRRGCRRPKAQSPPGGPVGPEPVGRCVPAAPDSDRTGSAKVVRQNNSHARRFRRTKAAGGVLAAGGTPRRPGTA